MINLRDFTITTFHQGLVAKKFTALEIAQQFFRRIEEKDKEIGAYLSLDADAAYGQAESVDIAIAQDKPMGWLAGVPLAIKDNILIEGQPATAASRILANYIAVYDAGVIKKLRAASAVFLGKTNLDEFAMGSSTENSALKKTCNPHDPERVPGGSSGGSAAAVASHLAVAALGSDTGGSIRQPAAFCQVVGLKPTYGAVSRSGLIAMASSLDQIGPITKTAADAARLFAAIAGRDPADATSAEVSYGEELVQPQLEKIRELKIGLPEEYFRGGLDTEIEVAIAASIKQLGSLKLKFKKVSLPHTAYALSCYYIIMPAEVSANLARFDGIRYAPLVGDDLGRPGETLEDRYVRTRSRGFGTEAKRRIILGTFVLSSGYYDAYYRKAQQVRALVRSDFERAFREVDVLLAPVSPTPPFKLGEKTDDPLAMYLSDIFTIPASLAGLPAVSIPPGFQLIGRPWREADILGIGQFYERLGV